MSDNKQLFSHFASVLGVYDMEQTLAFYRDKLGFTVNFTWQDPIQYAVLKRGDVGLHFTLLNEDKHIGARHTKVYVFVHDVQAVYEEFVEKDVKEITPPATYEYGMTDFDVTDPSGHILSFGKGSE